MDNILAPGRRRRFIVGSIVAALAVIAAAAAVALAAGPPWFGLVFLLAWLAALMLLQARDCT